MFDQVRAFMTAKCVTTGSAEYMAAQDEFGRANKTQLREFFDSLEDNERKTALWVAFSCLSYEMAADVLKIAVVEPVRAEFDAYMAKEETESFERQSKQFDADRLALAADRAQLKADQDKFESYKGAIHKRISQLRYNLHWQALSSKTYKADAQALRARMRENRVEIQKAKRLTKALKAMID